MKFPVVDESSSAIVVPQVKVVRGFADDIPFVEPLIRKTHEVGGPVGWTVERTLRILREAVQKDRDLGHFLLVAVRTEDGVEWKADGYLWAEILDAGDLWIHFVHGEHPGTARELYRVIEGMAEAAKIHRLVGFFWRMDRIDAYVRKWGVKIVGYIVAKEVADGRDRSPDSGAGG